MQLSVPAERLAVQAISVRLCAQVAPLPSTLATVPSSLTAININKQLGGSRRFSHTRSYKDDDAVSQGSGASRLVLLPSSALPQSRVLRSIWPLSV